MKESLQNRIKALQNAIAWSRENGGLTTGQRICIHQDIARAMHNLEALNDGMEATHPQYLPEGLEEKTAHIIRVIRDKNWEKQELKY